MSRRRQIVLASVDRSRVRWTPAELEARLRLLWQMRGRALVLPLTVRNLRSIGACRRRVDRDGWSLWCQPQLKSDTIAVYMNVKRYGNRPAWGRARRNRG